MEEYTTSYEFHKIGKSVINILTNQISALYYTSIKDRLYCENVDSPSRRAAQYTLFHILEIMSQIIGPILPHLVEEIFLNSFYKESKTFFTGCHHRLDNSCSDTDLEIIMEDVLNWRKDLSKIIEGRTSEMEISIRCSKNVFRNLKVELNKKILKLCHNILHLKLIIYYDY